MITRSDGLVVSDYVVCATLRKIADVFNVMLLWDRMRGGQEGVFLLEALKRYPRLPFGRQRKETCYSHVVVRVPEKDYLRDDRLDDGGGREALRRELQRVHERQLSHALADNASVRYRIEPDPVLRPGEVQFLFGRAIYLPANEDSPLFRIEAATENQSDWRELGPIYAGQRLTLLNADRCASSFVVEGWPFLNGESILLVLRAGASTQVDALSEPPNSLDLANDDEGSFVVSDRRRRTLRLRMAPGTAGVAEALLASARKVIIAPARPEQLESLESLATPFNELRGLERTAPVADAPYPVTDIWGRREPIMGLDADFGDLLNPGILEEQPKPPRPSAGALASHRENVDQQLTWIPQQQSAVTVQIVGITLPRLSMYTAAGVSGWRLGFDRMGKLASDSHSETLAFLHIDKADQLFGDAEEVSTPLLIPGIWRPCAEWELVLYAFPPPMDRHYLGWTRLPSPLGFPVPLDRAISFGRSEEADLAPHLLADPHSLRWDNNASAKSGITAEYLGLSRRHVLLQAHRDNGWEVRLESQTMSAYRLTPLGDLLGVLSPGEETTTTAKPDELLVVGGYVLALGTTS